MNKNTILSVGSLTLSVVLISIFYLVEGWPRWFGLIGFGLMGWWWKK